jgi:hypothetical protein
MEISVVQFSIVIVGDAHNPTILNPDFLEVQGIVSKDWGWEVAEVITTPPFAVVRYKNGYSITVEKNKLQITDPGEDPEASLAPAIAQQYVKTLPHVRYKAAGINFNTLVERTDPHTYLKQRFIRRGPWDNPEHPLTGIGLRFIYSLTGGQVVLSLDVGQAERVVNEKPEIRSVILANANFHRDCKEYPASKQIETFLGQYSSDWAEFQSLVTDVLMTEASEK